MARSLINVKLVPVDRSFDKLIDFSHAWGGEYEERVAQKLADVRRGIRERARRKPGSPAYPIRWTPSSHPEDVAKKPNTKFGYYSRQKAAFYATGGFGAGIPTIRTGGIGAAWDVRTRKQRNNFVFELTNDDPSYPFVQGENQQMFHTFTGWETGDEIVDDLQLYVDAEVPLILDELVTDYLEK